MEEAALRCLTVDSCADLLCALTSSQLGACRGGTDTLGRAGRALALREFEAVAVTAGFRRLPEADVAALLDDDALEASGEDAVLAAVARWIAAAGPGPGVAGDGGIPPARWRGEALLERIRWPLVRAAGRGGGGGLEEAAALLPGCAPLQALLREASGHGEGSEARWQRLGPAAFVPRRTVSAASTPPPRRFAMQVPPRTRTRPSASHLIPVPLPLPDPAM